MIPIPPYRLQFDPRAWKEIMALPEAVQHKIFDSAEKLESGPRPSGCKKLQGAVALYRVRVGDYRIVYEIQDALLVVTVVRVGNRKNVYG